MDQIKIDGLRFFAHHGVYDFETEQGQIFEVSAVMETDTHPAGISDNLEDSVSYAEVAHLLYNELTQNTYQLLEAAAENACRSVLLHFPKIHAISLELRKPDAPIELDFQSVSVKIRRAWHTAYIALGSNLGDKEAFIRNAVRSMAESDSIQLTALSSLIVTEPYGGVKQDDFLNGVCEIKTLFTPEELLSFLHTLEASAGRERTIVWGPRTLDLDILLYDDLVLHTPSLTIPHPDMTNRDFVLRPLTEIARYAIHPLTKKTAGQLLEELEAR